MGMKARDIIPGWPRGRSTSSFEGNWAYVNDGFFFRCSDEMRASLRLDAEYHRGQQAMMERYFAQYRSREPVLFQYWHNTGEVYEASRP
jgi:hypothetical protein